jgi:hypothetical protein
MAEYILLLIVSMVIFLSLFAAFNAAGATASHDATAIAAENLASTMSTVVSEAVGDGDVSTSMPLDLPDDICGKSYLIYPAPDGRHIIVRVNHASERREYRSPLTLRKEGILIDGFIVSGQCDRGIDYDVETRTVKIS